MNNALNESILSSSVSFPFNITFFLFQYHFLSLSVSLSFPFPLEYFLVFSISHSPINNPSFCWFSLSPSSLYSSFFSLFLSLFLPSLSLFLPSLYFFLFFSPLGIPGSFQPCSLIFFHTSEKTWEETVLNPKKRIP